MKCPDNIDCNIAAEEVIALLRKKQWTLTTAESCTGGAIAKTITDISGVSDVYAGGVIPYSNEMKHKFLGIPWRIINGYGAVSSEVARAMVNGLQSSPFMASLSVTGIAGPTGGTKEKPIGLVYICTFIDSNYQINEYHFSSTREEIRRCSVYYSLQQLRDHLLQNNTEN